MISSFREIIALWDTPAALGAAIGAKPDTVRKWGERDRIPPEYWQRTIDAAKAKGRSISAEDLTRLASKGGAA